MTTKRADILKGADQVIEEHGKKAIDRLEAQMMWALHDASDESHYTARSKRRWDETERLLAIMREVFVIQTDTSETTDPD